MSTVERTAGVVGSFNYELTQVPAGIPAMTIYSDAARTVVAVASTPLVATANPSVFKASYPASLAAGTYYLSFVTVVTAGQPAFVDNDDVLVLVALLGSVGETGPYGSSIGAIEGLLPWRTFPENDEAGEGRVTRPQVLGFLAAYGARVAARIGTLLDVADPAVRERLVDAAANVVNLGAASQAEAAAVPETADPESPSSYAAWLRAQFNEAFAELVAAYEETVEEAEVLDPSGAGDPAWSFPDPAGLGARGV